MDEKKPVCIKHPRELTTTRTYGISLSLVRHITTILIGREDLQKTDRLLGEVTSIVEIV